MIKVNQHIQNLKPSATLAINQKVIELRCEGNEVFHFGFGQSPFPIHHSIVNALIANAANNNYFPTVGFEPLRKTIANFLADFYKIEVSTDDILIGPGSKELLYQTILILEGEFLIPKGSWVSYGPQIKSKGVSYQILETNFKDNFKLKPITLDSYCVNNPKGQKTLILNSPNNPTGAVYSNSELKALAKICKRHNILVLSDEIYSLISFSGLVPDSMAYHYPENTFVFGGLSKVFSAGGYRLGFLKLPPNSEELQRIYLSLFSETFSAVASPVQYAAIEAFSMNEDLTNYIKTGSKILKGIANYVFKELSQVGVQCTQPQGAFYMMIGFNKYKSILEEKLGIKTSKELASYLLVTHGVALLPGSDFYFAEEDLFFRLAYVDFNGKNIQNKTFLDTTIDRDFIRTNCPNIYKGVNELIQFTRTL